MTLYNDDRARLYEYLVLKSTLEKSVARTGIEFFQALVNHLTQTMRKENTYKISFTHLVDEPDVRLGVDNKPKPSEQNLKVESIRSSLKNDLDVQPLRETTYFRLEAWIKKLQEMVKLAQIRLPVFNTTSESVPHIRLEWLQLAAVLIK